MMFTHANTKHARIRYVLLLIRDIICIRAAYYLSPYEVLRVLSTEALKLAKPEQIRRDTGMACTFVYRFDHVRLD